MTTAELIDTVMGVGRRLLETGAETYRVEESVRRISAAYGADVIGVYAVPTAIIATVAYGAETPVTRVCRIYDRGTNLSRLDALNALSRELCAQPLPYAAVQARLDAIDRSRRYGTLTQALASGGGAAFFTWLFGGELTEGLCAFAIDLTLCPLLRFFERIHTNTLFLNAVGGAWIGTLALLAQRCGLLAGVDGVIIGSIMLLVPGLPLTNAIRDLIAGDFVAGTTKFVEVLLIAAGIAVGAALPLSIGAWMGGI